MHSSTLIAFIGGLLLTTACSLTVAPVLPAVPPPPDVLPGQLLFVVPSRYVETQGMPMVFKDRKVRMPLLLERDPERARQIGAREIVTGMSSQHVIWAFLSHPTRVVDDGPPGGHIMLWEQGPAFVRGRYWVRTDQDGTVWSAGRF
ncbi:MAG: hypothetical protein ACI9EF_001622 [Pseudohongiellaceae bacterium]